MFKQIAIVAATLTGLVVSQPTAAFFEVPIDHKNSSMGMYKMQYIVDDQYFYNYTGDIK